MTQPTTITDQEFTKLFINYALFPTDSQKSLHFYGLSSAILYFITDISFYGFITIIYYYHLLDIKHLLTIIPFILFIIIDSFVSISNIIAIRNGIIYDLTQYLMGYASDAVYKQYKPFYKSINEFMANKRYYLYQQNKSPECAICLEAYDPNINNQSLLYCGHKFHSKCIRANEIVSIKAKVKKKCPICRSQYNGSRDKFIFNPHYHQQASIFYKNPSFSWTISEQTKIIKDVIIEFIRKTWKILLFLFFIPINITTQ